MDPYFPVQKTLERVSWSSALPQDQIHPDFHWGFSFGPEADKELTTCKHLQQIHGVDIIHADRLQAGIPDSDAEGKPVAGDGIWMTQQTSKSETTTKIAVKTADCLPLLMHGVNDSNKIAMAIHAGWRGFTAGIIDSSLEILTQNGFCERDIRIIIGPAISCHRFEIGPEVLEAFLHYLGSQAATACTNKGNNDRWHADLQTAAVLKFIASGFLPEQMTVIRLCTFDGGLPSYRRDGKGCGRLVSWIGFS